MRNILTIAFVEARISLRGWRFWLLLSLTVGLSFFARYDYIRYVEAGFYLHPGYSFTHPSMALMLVVFLMGAALIALDVCGRLQRTRMDLILHPLPVHSLTLTLGRFFSVLLILAPISALGLFSLGGWQYLHGHSVTVWQPYAIAWLLLVGSMLPPITALAVTLRSLVKYDFAALLLLPIFASFIIWGGLATGLMLNPLTAWVDLANASPTQGALISPIHYAAPLSAHAALCVALLLITPLYYRRMEPQRPLLPANRKLAWISFPAFRRWLSSMRFERNLGWGFHLILLIGLLAASSAGWSAYHTTEQARTKREIDLAEAARQQEDLRPAPAQLVSVSVELTPSAMYDRLDFRARIDLIAEEELPILYLELDPRYRIASIDAPGRTVDFERWREAIAVRFSTPIALGERFTLDVEYDGAPERFHPAYSALDDRWLPLPWRRERLDQRWTQTRDHFFDAEIVMRLRPDQNAAFPGERVSVEEFEGGRIERWRTGHPVNNVHIHWGRYRHIDLEHPIARLRFFHFEGHAYQAGIYLEEIRDQVDVVRQHLGPLPFPQLTIVETPYELAGPVFAVFQRQGGGQVNPHHIPMPSNRMPGLLRAPENHIMYLHQGVWLLDRLDLDPRAVPFFQQLRPVLERISNNFYNGLIEGYYRETLSPAGEYAFWLRDHLVSYTHKLLESNPWRQRGQLRYDIGHRSDLPLSVARNASLLDLHRNAYRALETVRGEGIFRMVHHLIGNESWWALNRRLFEEMQYKPLTADDFFRLAEEESGEDLGWFQEQWLEGTALPEYVITLAEARLFENPEKMAIEYDVIIRVHNRGTGRMKTPIYLETERDFVIRDLWLDEGEERSLRLIVPHRPVFATVDPHHWVLQLPPINERNRRRMRSEARVFVIGDQREAALR